MEENKTTATQEQAQPLVQDTQVSTPKEDNKERNLALMRKRLEAEEQARLAAERRAEEAIKLAEAAQSQNQQQPQQTNEEEDAIDPDDYLQGKTFKKTTSKIKSTVAQQAQRMAELEQRLATYETKSELSSIKDFYEVVTDENLATMARLYPEDYETVMANKNLTLKSKTVYNMLKNYGIADPVQKKTEERIERNKQKPMSASSASSRPSETPLTRLGDYERRVLTENDRDRILAEVNRKKMLG